MRNIFDQLQYNIAAPLNDDDCEEEDEDDEDYPSKKKEDFDSDDPVERKFIQSNVPMLSVCPSLIQGCLTKFDPH